MNSSQLVTIILPVFNAQPYLDGAIKSLLSQTMSNFELIILEDGSTDNSLQYLLTLNEPRIRLVYDGMNRGLAYRLNQGIQEAKGKYICRMDADDISLPNRLQLQTEFLEEHPEVDLVGGRAVAFSSLIGILGCLPFARTHEELCARPWNRIPLPHPTWVARRDWFLANPYRSPEVIRAEDQALLLQAYPVSRYHCIDDIVLAYRIGKYSLNSALVARYSLFKVQIFIFLQRQQYSYVALACLICLAKSFVDILRNFSFIDGIVSSHKITPLAPELIQSIEALIVKSRA